MVRKVELFFNERPFEKFGSENWFSDASIYLQRRFPAIVDRMYLALRYVDLHPINKDTFSYEFASIIRDIGSIFSSVMDRTLTGMKWPKKRSNYDINDFIQFLLQEIPDLEQVAVWLNVDAAYRLILPFSGFRGEKCISVWWISFRKLKHSDIDHLEMGCLSSALYAFSALASICIVYNVHSGRESDLTHGIIGQIRSCKLEQLEQLKHYIFPLPTKYDEWIAI